MKVFYSFHYDADVQRVHQIRNINKFTKNDELPANDWEALQRSGEVEIQKWIKEQLKGCDCLVVLNTKGTPKRPWVQFEIKEAWNSGIAVLAVDIHKIHDLAGNSSLPGSNPFDNFYFKSNPELKLSFVADFVKPKALSSKGTYQEISENLELWVSQAISIRKNCESSDVLKTRTP